jgi:hypothetical protein
MASPYQLPDLIAERLASLDWPVRHVADLGQSIEELQIVPAILIIPYGLRIIDITAVRETVLVTAVTRSTNLRSAQPARQEAGTILAAASALLREWQPDTGHSPLTQETPPQPQFVNGVGIYPLQFSAEYELL